MSSLHNIDGELPETLGSIKSVTDSQEAVMSFYYTDAANQVRCVFHLPTKIYLGEIVYKETLSVRLFIM